MVRLPPPPPKVATQVLEEWLEAHGFDLQQGAWPECTSGYWVTDTRGCADADRDIDALTRAVVHFRGSRPPQDALVAVAEALEEAGAGYGWQYTGRYQALVLVVTVTQLQPAANANTGWSVGPWRKAESAADAEQPEAAEAPKGDSRD